MSEETTPILVALTRVETKLDVYAEAQRKQEKNHQDLEMRVTSLELSRAGQNGAMSLGKFLWGAALAAPGLGAGLFAILTK